ncbi:MAG: zinc-binding dehydrogenase [Planctomycetota bacterium]|nr:zinc-binding dehydrogenase [Planctomycetota bacterium]
MPTMKAAIISKQGTPVTPNIQVVDDWPEPAPSSGELLIRTEASAMNHMDLWVGMGLPGLDLQYPRISGSDGAGIVEGVGDGVHESWIGRRVLLNAAMPIPDPRTPDHDPAPQDITMIGEHVNGANAAKFVAPVRNVLDIGETNPCEAAAFGLTHLTAWRMLWTRAQLKPGSWVLITGIGGGVATSALNIARHFGCKTIVTSRSEAKLAKAKELGADHGVLDEGEDWSREVRDITGKRGVDVCADSVGKAIHLSCVKSLARGGTFVTCGCTTGHNPETDLARVFWNQLNIMGSTMGSMAEFSQVVALLKCGAIKPVIDCVIDADDAPKAWARLEAAEQFGKIVIKWS